MDKTDKLIERTEKLLARVQELQATLRQLGDDLSLHSQALLEQLAKVSKREAAPAPVRPLSRAERRATPRRKGNPISVQITNGARTTDAVQGWVVDRSTGGLRLLVDEAVPAGTLLHVRPAKVHAKFPWVQVRVKNCYPERRSWSLGCQFVNKMSWEELQHFG
jgi:hypothetical protein